VEPGMSDVPLLVDAPQEVGADRLCDIVGGVTLYGAPLIVVNFGTATTFDCVNGRGEFIGGAIAPGLVTASEALISRTSRLFRVELLKPKEAIGRNTATNIQSGLTYGWAGLVDGLVERMRSEMGAPVKVVATGGLADQMRGVAKSIDVVNPDLTLEGLRVLWERANPAEGARDGRRG
jgi:type III pantothenate kinase